MKRSVLSALVLLICLSAIAGTLAVGVGSSSPRQFSGAANAPPSGKAPKGAVRFVALGDMGTGDNSQFAIARQMVKYHDERPYDVVLMLGDNIYGDGDPTKLPLRFEQPYAELLKRGVSFHAVLGNHDVSRGRAAQISYGPFNMGGRGYYSFLKGGDLIEFFALDSNAMDAAQLQWLDTALAGSKAQWKIAYFHHPIYSSGRFHGSSMKLRRLLEPLFVRYGVAAVLSGHDHIYERTRPQQGIQYFVSGAGGQLRRGNINRGSPFFAAGNDSVHSFMYVEVTSDRLAYWAVDAQGNVLDSGTMTPPPGTPKTVVSRYHASRTFLVQR